MLNNLFAKQFRKPSGIFGKYISKKLFKMNATTNDWVIENCNIKSSDQILELGYGPGYAIEKIASVLNTGKVYGIDFSTLMHKHASRQNRKHIRTGKVELISGSVENMTFPDDHFDLVFGVNIVYFWSDPAKEIDEILRVLKPGGRLVLYHTDKESLRKIPVATYEVFTGYTTVELETLLSSRGLRHVQTRSRKETHNGIDFLSHCAVTFKDS
jgi:ubiquinone/menaquinone biosynthesis C-methylase UbiE